MKSQYILMPKEGIKAKSDSQSHSFLTNLPFASSTSDVQKATIANAEMEIIDAISENGPKLVSMDSEMVDKINEENTEVRMIPVVEYGRPNPKISINNTLSNALAVSTVTMQVVDDQTNLGITGADVIAFTNFQQRYGDSGVTDASGNVDLNLNGNTIERLYIYAPAGYWGAFRTQLSIQSMMSVKLVAVSLPYTDCVRHYYGQTKFDDSLGVKVGIIDTGVGPHADLNVAGGRNTVTGESKTDFQDSDTHGTHVAGLVGSNNHGLRGMAPNIPMYSYRVFGKGGSGATNYSILKAMIFAADDECDIVNLSLGGGPFDYIVDEAIEDARNSGMLVIVAAGNDGRKPVSYPAAYSGATAVSAMGREGTFPSGSLDEGEIARPPHAIDAKEFIAGFSNIGTEIAITGLGVGTLSTLPNNTFGPMSGTSMAAPVIAGAAACLLSQNQAIYQMNRDHMRSKKIEQLLQATCIKRGFGLNYEGYGLPDPNIV